jgi:hypothetical protein
MRRIDRSHPDALQNPPPAGGPVTDVSGALWSVLPTVLGYFGFAPRGVPRQTTADIGYESIDAARVHNRVTA